MKNTHRIEISPPDISACRAGNTGVDYVHVLDSGKPGPNVMVQVKNGPIDFQPRASPGRT